MCGIVGVVGGRRGIRSSALADAVAALAHRGPDGHGFFETDEVAFGHTRLSILDTTDRAEQPMLDAGSGCALVFNGEIYNYIELRRALEGLGHRFTSSGDTQVLLHAYLEWGEDCLPRLNGMFAFALWDPRSRSVFLARDRFGEKPLFIVDGPGRLWFASEAKALFAAGALTAAADDAFVFRFLATGDLGHPTETAFDRIRQLPAAHAATVAADGSVRTWRWWSPPEDAAEIGGPGGVDILADRVQALLVDAVDMRLRSDVPVGTSLSGGVDSTLVIDLVRAIRPDGSIHAFTAGFPGTGADELPIARRTAERLGVELHPVELDGSELTAEIDRVHFAQEAPIESPSIFAQFKVMEAAASAGVTVLLDGQGGDETWAGYPKYARMQLTDDLVTGRLGAARRHARQWRDTQQAALRPETARYLALLGGAARRAVPLALRAGPRWLAPSYRRAHLDADLMGGVDEPAAHAGRVAERAWRRDLDRITLPRLLRYADRNSMAWSREVRLPYLDHRLVELACRSQFAAKLQDGWTKEPLRAVLAARGMTDIARRPGKYAFAPPSEQWLGRPQAAARADLAWARLGRAGMVAGDGARAPAAARWRVLSVVTWADAFEVAIG